MIDPAIKSLAYQIMSQDNVDPWFKLATVNALLRPREERDDLVLKVQKVKNNHHIIVRKI